MVSVTAQSVVRQIESLYDGGSVAGMSDRQLIERFVARRDAGGENAFSALVARHGPMVLGVCQKLLGDRQQAEDEFQAVFLVLARRARSIRDPDLLGNRLYGIVPRAQGPGTAGPPEKIRGGSCREIPRSIDDNRHGGSGGNRSKKRPRGCTLRSSGCREPSACRWCSATSRGSRSTRPQRGFAARPERHAVAWSGRDRLAVASLAAA